MRKLPTLFTTLLCCTSLALAQMDEDVSSEEFEESAPAVEEAAPEAAEEPAEEASEPEESVAEASTEAEPAAEESSDESPVEESVEPAPVEEAVAEAPAEEPAAAPVADRSKPAETVPYQPLVVNASSKLDPKTQVTNVEEGLDTLANNMESTLMGKDDLPLAVSGYMAFRLKNFHYSEPSPWVQNDLARTSVDAVLNMNIVAMPNSYMTLWTNMSFPFALSGTYSNYLGSQPRVPASGDQLVNSNWLSAVRRSRVTLKRSSPPCGRISLIG